MQKCSTVTVWLRSCLSLCCFRCQTSNGFQFSLLGWVQWELVALYKTCVWCGAGGRRSAGVLPDAAWTWYCCSGLEKWSCRLMYAMLRFSFGNLYNGPCRFALPLKLSDSSLWVLLFCAWCLLHVCWQSWFAQQVPLTDEMEMKGFVSTQPCRNSGPGAGLTETIS